MENKVRIALVWMISLTAIWAFWPVEQHDIHTRTFCAYGKVFVEFQRGNKTWGTMMLNHNGKPISCEENEESPKETTGTSI